MTMDLSQPMTYANQNGAEVKGESEELYGAPALNKNPYPEMLSGNYGYPGLQQTSNSYPNFNSPAYSNQYYSNNMQLPSSNFSPTSPTFPHYHQTHRPQLYSNGYNSNLYNQHSSDQSMMSPALRSPTTSTPTSYSHMYSTPSQLPYPPSMSSIMESNGNSRPIPPPLNLANSAFRTNTGEHININQFEADMHLQHALRSQTASALPSPGILSPIHPPSTPNSAVHTDGGSMLPANRSDIMPSSYSRPTTPLQYNEQLQFLAQNPQYLSGLAGQAVGNSSKISRAIASQLFAPDEMTSRFPCTLCGQDFKRINGLKRHLMMHLHIKPYKCEMCGRGFCRIDVYKRHAQRGRCLKEH